MVGAGPVGGTTEVALSATGDIGTDAATRLNVDTPLLAADGANVFIASGGGGLDTVNGVTNQAAGTYDLDATGTITVTGGVSADKTYLASGGDSVGAGEGRGTR